MYSILFDNLNLPSSASGILNSSFTCCISSASLTKIMSASFGLLTNSPFAITLASISRLSDIVLEPAALPTWFRIPSRPLDATFSCAFSFSQRISRLLMSITYMEACLASASSINLFTTAAGSKSFPISLSVRFITPKYV